MLDDLDAMSEPEHALAPISRFTALDESQSRCTCDRVFKLELKVSKPLPGHWLKISQQLILLSST
jgi:hypothetical protein